MVHPILAKWWSRPRSRFENNRHFLWTSAHGFKDRANKYGSYKHVSERHLLGREYDVYWADGQPCIFFLDEYHHETAYRNIRIADLEAGLSFDPSWTWGMYS